MTRGLVKTKISLSFVGEGMDTWSLSPIFDRRNSLAHLIKLSTLATALLVDRIELFSLNEDTRHVKDDDGSTVQIPNLQSPWHASARGEVIN